MFIQRKIIGRLHGEEKSDFDAISRWRALEDDVKRFGKDNPLTVLQPILKDVDPDDCFSTVPYGKDFFK
jgi:leukotriene-A4 hydrolase